MHSLTPLLAGFEGNLKTLPEQLLLGILTGSIYALIALGYTMVYGILKLINFAHGEIFMLGAYIGLFVSTAAVGNAATRLPTNIASPETVTLVSYGLIAVGALLVVAFYVAAKVKKLSAGRLFIGLCLIGIGALGWVLAHYQPQAITLVVMMLASMVGCAIVGIVIEFLAYRPMRSQPRISALITAIGVSMFIQFSGQLFLPVSPPPTVLPGVNPYSGSTQFYLKPPPKEIGAALDKAQADLTAQQTAYDDAVLANNWDEFDPPPQGKAMLDAKQIVERETFRLQGEVRDKSVSVNLPTGQIIMFFTAIVLMIGLRYLVMKTATGRAMRAVSHDFDAASLMGVNVNKIVAFTFIIGSALAGAGAMMNSTFLGTQLTSFYGLIPGVKAFVAAVLGGIGNIPGAVLGGLLMGVAEGLVTWAGYSSLKDAIAFIILIVMLLLRPGGLLGSSAVEKV